ncbi:hypothetical protein RHMOL_Rhmol07G0082800 [Rhododendron molle]|uniref:Uncharacterized protein n=1 Tax=Rhododendron molle TaxID=49168 RepID=A0ACC0MZ46_RHOML|nr:hypothetical protein RHMOL_Rhmol07G0082800 [Rhododendron molle]
MRFSYQIWRSYQAHLVLVDTDHIYETWRRWSPFVFHDEVVYVRYGPDLFNLVITIRDYGGLRWHLFVCLLSKPLWNVVCINLVR